MNEIIDKILLLLCCTTLYILNTDTSFIIVPVIIVVVLTCLFQYFDDDRIRLAGNLIYCFLCLFFPSLLLYLPLTLYDIIHTKYQYTVLAAPIAYFYNFDYYSPLAASFTAVIILISFALKYKTDHFNSLTAEYNDLRDSSTRLSQLLEEKNQTLLQNQDYEIKLATLNERNRISKEIHDNVGHLLSRSLLQVGALLTITKEEIMKEELSLLKMSLSDGMDQIRNSIHNMYDDSIDLYIQIENLVKNFSFCAVSYDYDMKEQPSLQVKHAFIAITKEALANIIRHSNATKVSILLREHPAMYQLIIQDNGEIPESTKKLLIKAFEKQEYEDGIGLRNMVDRVKSLNGNINITFDQGYKIFISVPKKNQEQTR